MAVRVRERSGLRGLVEFSYEAACRMAHDPVARAGFRLRVEGEPDGEGTHGAELRWLSWSRSSSRWPSGSGRYGRTCCPWTSPTSSWRRSPGCGCSPRGGGADLDRRLRRLWDALLRMVLAEGSTFSFRPPREAGGVPARPAGRRPGTPGTTPGKDDRPEARALRNKIAENGEMQMSALTRRGFLGAG
ncbi:hypothetical protein ACFQ3Z_03490 [Streptomyces nogalater]